MVTETLYVVFCMLFGSSTNGVPLFSDLATPDHIRKLRVYRDAMHFDYLEGY